MLVFPNSLQINLLISTTILLEPLQQLRRLLIKKITKKWEKTMYPVGLNPYSVWLYPLNLVRRQHRSSMYSTQSGIDAHRRQHVEVRLTLGLSKS